MKKLSLSIFAGLTIGGFVSSLFMDYKNQGYEIMNYYGNETFKVNELDFDFLFNATIIVIALSILFFTIWTLIEKSYS